MLLYHQDINKRVGGVRCCDRFTPSGAIVIVLLTFFLRMAEPVD